MKLQTIIDEAINNEPSFKYTQSPQIALINTKIFSIIENLGTKGYTYLIRLIKLDNSKHSHEFGPDMVDFPPKLMNLSINGHFQYCTDFEIDNPKWKNEKTFKEMLTKACENKKLYKWTLSYFGFSGQAPYGVVIDKPIKMVK